MGRTGMKRIDYITRELEPIHVQNMHFRIISKQPHFSSEKAESLKKEIQKNLYDIFRQYV